MQAFDPDNIQLGPSRSAWTSGSSSMRLGRPKEEPVQETRNKFSMLSTHDTGPSSLGPYQMQAPSFDSGRPPTGGPSRSIGVPGRGSRGPSAETDRRRGYDGRPQAKMSEASGPTASLGPNMYGRRPQPETRSEAGDVLEQTRKLKGKADMSPSEVENQSKLLLDEYLHEGSEQVCHFSNRLAIIT